MGSFFFERLIKGGIVILFLGFFGLLDEYEHLFLRLLFFSVKSFLTFGFAERLIIFSPIFSFSDFLPRQLLSAGSRYQILGLLLHFFLPQ